MNPTAALSISAHRLARLIAWARLWLQGFAAVLMAFTAFDPPAAQRALLRMARHVTVLVIVRTTMRLARRAPRLNGRLRMTRASMRRRLIGSDLRRRLRGRGAVALFFAILCVMRDLDAIVARQCKRLARGLTRLRPILPAPEREQLTPAARALPLASADTS